MRLLFVIIFSSLTFYGYAQGGIANDIWTELLQKHVDGYGKVDYHGFKSDEKRLDEYLTLISNNAPTPYWDVNVQKAYWINAYNAFTIKLILMYYPIKSIMEIKEGELDAWHLPFIVIGGKKYTLDYIENTMLRGQYNDSRIHFAINCSAKSCPVLKNKAYEAGQLELQLRLATRVFINDERFNRVSENHLQLSQLFNWYKDDFLKEESSIQVYVNNNTPHVNVSPKASLGFLDYNWDLNEKKK